LEIGDGSKKAADRINDIDSISGRFSCYPSAALRTSFDEERGETPPQVGYGIALAGDFSLSLEMTSCDLETG